MPPQSSLPAQTDVTMGGAVVRGGDACGTCTRQPCKGVMRVAWATYHERDPGPNFFGWEFQTCAPCGDGGGGDASVVRRVLRGKRRVLAPSATARDFLRSDTRSFAGETRARAYTMASPLHSIHITFDWLATHARTRRARMRERRQLEHNPFSQPSQPNPPHDRHHADAGNRCVCGTSQTACCIARTSRRR
jgi:hypothetical protein